LDFAIARIVGAQAAVLSPSTAFGRDIPIKALGTCGLSRDGAFALNAERAWASLPEEEAMGCTLAAESARMEGDFTCAVYIDAFCPTDA
jgi:hypothetical protein